MPMDTFPEHRRLPRNGTDEATDLGDRRPWRVFLPPCSTPPNRPQSASSRPRAQRARSHLPSRARDAARTSRRARFRRSRSTRAPPARSPPIPPWSATPMPRPLASPEMTTRVTALLCPPPASLAPSKLPVPRPGSTAMSRLSKCREPHETLSFLALSMPLHGRMRSPTVPLFPPPPHRKIPAMCALDELMCYPTPQLERVFFLLSFP